MPARRAELERAGRSHGGRARARPPSRAPSGVRGAPQHAFGARVVRRVAGLAHPLQVGRGQRGRAGPRARRGRRAAARGCRPSCRSARAARPRAGADSPPPRSEDGEAGARTRGAMGISAAHDLGVGGCGTGAWAGSMRPNFASKPLSGSATYGNEVRNGFSLRSTPSPSGICLPPCFGLQQRAGDHAQLDVGDVVGQAAAVREAGRCHPRARRSGSGWRSAARRG